MANLVKINKVYLFIGFGSTPEVAAECVKARDLLESNKIPFTLLNYLDADSHAGNCAALSTWTWGSDFHTKTFTDFPIVHWTEYFDDFERYLEGVQGLDALVSSNLLKNKDKVTA
jgi:hypothetical protein